MFVVFHAGLGQEASQDFDPTIYDVRSAYIDEEMLEEVSSLSWLYDNNIKSGLVLPETLNWIFYDVIEDIFPLSFIEQNDLSNLYCDIQIGMTGLFAHILGFHFGFPLMSNTETGDTRIGKFGLMDVGWSNMNGIIPPRPNPWTRSNKSEKYDNNKPIYLFTINKRYDLDGDFSWNIAKNINHRCNPNSEVDGTGYKIYVTAIKAVSYTHMTLPTSHLV